MPLNGNPCQTHASHALMTLDERLTALEERPAGETGAHTHEIDEVTGLQTALDGKQASGSYAASNHNHDSAYAAIDHTHAASGGLKSGLANLTAGGSSNVVFATPFASVPQVVVTSQTNNADTSCTYSVHSVTVNGFTIRGAGNPAGNVAWIATTAGNG